MYLVTLEDKDGMWFDDPDGFSTQQEAKVWVASRRPPPAGHTYVLWQCTEIATLREADVAS